MGNRRKYNMQGQVVNYTKASNTELTLSGSNLTAGVYLIVVNDVFGNTTRKKVIVD